MREIKFRAWLKNRKVMGKVKEIHFGERITTVAMHDGNIGGITWFETDNPHVVLMQYIGVKDNDEVEIYEGDILTFTAYGKKYIGEVINKDGNYSIICKNASPLVSHVLEGRGLKVVGNIYENIDLL